MHVSETEKLESKGEQNQNQGYQGKQIQDVLP